MTVLFSDAVASKVEALRDYADQHGVELENRVPMGIVSKTDLDLALVLIEGLVNVAIKHGCEGDKITVSSECNAGKVSVAVLLNCAKDAPAFPQLEGSRTLIEPLLRLLRADLEMTCPDETSLLLRMLLPNGIEA